MDGNIIPNIQHISPSCDKRHSNSVEMKKKHTRSHIPAWGCISALDSAGMHPLLIRLKREKKCYLLFLFILCFPVQSYAEYMCSSWSSTADNGTIYDSGGAGGNYSNNEICGFLIQPSSSPSDITLNFSELYIEPYYEKIWDYLEVYDGSSASGTLLGRFYGYYSPNSVSVTATSGSMYLRFFSDPDWGEYPGFIASWTSSTSSTSCDDVEDNFSSPSFNNNNGSQNWTNSWQEVGESDGIYAGKVRVRSDLCTSGYCLRLGTPSEEYPSYYSNRGVTRQVNLSGYTSASLSFNYFTGVNTGSSIVNLSISNDGGTNWTLLRSYNITTTNVYANAESFDITPYISANTQIRFLGSGNDWSVTGMYIDDIKIDYCQATAGSGDTPATTFNCVKKDTNGISGKLYTKTTAQSFRFDVVALQDAGTIETSFASGADHTLTIEVVNAETAASCDSYPALTPAISQSLNMTAADAGTKTSAYMSSNTAYRKLKCRVTDTTSSPSVVGCSTDSFAIRPTGMSISSNLTNASSTGTPKAKTGENFTLTATATAGYNGTPSINNSKLQAHIGANQTGSISGSFNAGDSVTGIATGSAFIYSEVGSLRFATQGIYDDSFTAVDQPDDCTDDFSNTMVSGKVGCKFGNTTTSAYFGRFTPDHFDVTLNTPIFSPSCSTFTYLDQPIKYTVNPIVTLLAKNSSDVTTQNYTGDYWKINPSSFTPVYTAFSYPLTVLESSAPTDTDNGNGTGLLSFANTSSDILKMTKGSLTAPIDADIALSFNLTDTDSVTVANVDNVAQVNPLTFGTTSIGNGISFSGNHKSHRWGRVSLDNTHGSELTPLSIPLYTEYYNGTNFIQNTADNCTAFSTANNFSISDASDVDCSFTTQTTPVSIGTGSIKASLLNSTLITGKSELIISDDSVSTKGAGAGNTGYVDITSNLASLPWLLYDWDGDTVNDNCPTAKATFGIYKGNEKQIYFREVY